MDAGVDGIVVIAPVNAAVDSLRGLHPDLPVVVVAASELESLTSVAVDQVAGAQLATRHLLDLGHRTVLHVSGPDDWVDATARVKGWRSELASAGRVAYDLIPGDWSADSGYEAGKALLSRIRSGEQDITAVFVANDQMSLGLIRALHEGGILVPDDISIVGFDDIPESGHFLPPLTTIKQDFGAIGRRCVSMLIDRLNHRQTERPAPIQPALIVRSSSGPPRGRRVDASRR
jgi:DNA-binding LacI/PurR family transcriptional regulator